MHEAIYHLLYHSWFLGQVSTAIMIDQAVRGQWIPCCTHPSTVQGVPICTSWMHWHRQFLHELLLANIDTWGCITIWQHVDTMELLQLIAIDKV